MNVLYISDANSTVIESQVIGLINALKSGNINITLLISGKHDALKNLNTSYKVYKNFPALPVLHWLTVVSLYLALRNVERSTIIHLRTERCLRYLKILGFTKLYVDFRGLGLEETSLYKAEGSRILYKARVCYHKARRASLSKSSYHANYISPYLKNHLNLSCNVQSYTMIPSLVSDNFSFNLSGRMTIRKSLGIGEDEIVVVFSTSMIGKWQNNFEELLDHLDPNIWLLNLSRKEVNRPRTINKFLPYSEVGKFLSVADIGILIRSNDIVNNVSLPVKAVEYLSNGLHVFSNGSVPTLKYYADQKGMYLNSLEHIAKFKTNLDERFLNASHWHEFFGEKNIAQKYISQYKKIGSF